MYREDRARRQLHAAALLGIAQQQRQEPGLPVVRVQHIETTALRAHEFYHRFLKENETRIVVVVIALAVPIKIPSVEKFIARHQMQRQSRPHRQRVHLGIQLLLAQSHLQTMRALRFLDQWRLHDRPITGNDHRHLMPASGQSVPERADHVREPARFDIRVHLAGRVKNSHVATLRLPAHGSSRICRRLAPGCSYYEL